MLLNCQIFIGLPYKYHSCGTNFYQITIKVRFCSNQFEYPSKLEPLKLIMSDNCGHDCLRFIFI